MTISIRQVARVANQIKDLRSDLYGFGGHCGAAAQAINEVCFGGSAKICAVFNAALAEKNVYIGHIYVYFPDLELCLDADGVVKDESDMYDYAVLDDQDEEYQLLMEIHTGGFEDPAAYEKVVFMDLSENGHILQLFEMSYLDYNKAILEKSM